MILLYCLWILLAVGVFFLIVKSTSHEISLFLLYNQSFLFEDV